MRWAAGNPRGSQPNERHAHPKGCEPECRGAGSIVGAAGPRGCYAEESCTHETHVMKGSAAWRPPGLHARDERRPPGLPRNQAPQKCQLLFWGRNGKKGRHWGKRNARGWGVCASSMVSFHERWLLHACRQLAGIMRAGCATPEPATHAVMRGAHGGQAPGAAAVSQQPGRRGTWPLHTLSCSCSRSSGRGRGAAGGQNRAAGRRSWRACVVAHRAAASKPARQSRSGDSTHLVVAACGSSAAARLMACGSWSALPLMLAAGVSASAAGRRAQVQAK